MIHKFKRNTLWILTIVFWVMLFGILMAINVFNYQFNQADTRRILSAQQKILDLKNEKSVDAPLDNNQKLSIIYSVLVDEDQNYTVVFSTDGTTYSEKEQIKVAKHILSEKKDEGIWNHFRYKIDNADAGQIVSFVNYSIWERQQYQMLMYSLLIGAVGMIALFFVAIILTRWLIKPVITTFDKQKQFISDAGHELKTPLTVMKAGLDMLEGEYGPNKYFEYIREENNRMTDLIYELLSLSDLENSEERLSFVRLDLSRIIEGTCLPLECLAFEKGIHLELQIQDGIHIQGNEKQIRQLIEVLVDNAIKHTYLDGSVIVRLIKDKGNAVLQVKNEGDPIPETERDKIFDRFYRVDKARNRSEGRYGLGLSIAISIAQMHKSNISVECKDNWTIFSAKFN